MLPIILFAKLKLPLPLNLMPAIIIGTKIKIADITCCCRLKFTPLTAKDCEDFKARFCTKYTPLAKEKIRKP